MRKFLIFLGLFIAIANTVCAADNEVKVFSENNRFGLKDSSETIIVKPVYNKMILLGESSYIVQKRGKFGLIDLNGNILIPIKYSQVERILGKYLKIGTGGKYGLYDENGNAILPHEYTSIDLLFGGMFLTCKDYKYGVIRNNGEVILENKFDDIYMPKSNIMVINHNGLRYEIEQIQGGNLDLPQNIKDIKGDTRFSISEIVTKPGTAAGYSVVTGTDYFLKLFSSISPAHEKTIDELMLSQGADTAFILLKFSWLPKYPVVYARNYYRTLKTPNNGPLKEVKGELKRKLQ